MKIIDDDEGVEREVSESDGGERKSHTTKA